MTAARPADSSGSAVPNAERPALKRSVLHRRHEDLGASFGTRGNWLIPSRYGTGDDAIDGHALWMTDVSAVGKVQITGNVDAALRQIGQDTIEPLAVRRTAVGTVIRPGPDWAILVLKPTVDEELSTPNLDQLAGAASATNLTSGYVALVLGGQSLSDVLSRSLMWDSSRLKPGVCVAASWARIPAVLWSRKDFLSGIELWVAADHGRYAWDTLIELGATPIGWTAIESLGWQP